MCYHLHPGPFIRLHCQEMQLCILRVLVYNQYEYVSFENLFNSFTIFFFFPYNFHTKWSILFHLDSYAIFISGLP